MSNIRGQLSHIAAPTLQPQAWHSYEPTGPQAHAGIKISGEVERIKALERRPIVDLEGGSIRAAALVAKMTAKLARPQRSCDCQKMGRPCITELKPAQAWALYEAPLAGGLLAPIGVGHGKTGLNILMPLVMPNCRLAVLLVSPGLRVQLMRDYLFWREHFKVPSIQADKLGGHIVPGTPIIHVIPYSIFSRPESTNLLERLKPDLIISDEAHNLRYPDTARTGRLLRYFVKHPETRFCCWSGTLTGKSIKDFAHLSALSLRGGSPLPIDPEIVDEWAAALDPSEWPAPPGALRVFMRPGEDLRPAMHRRLIETRGVVSTKTGAISADIYISERPITLPKELSKIIGQFRKDWIRPDGEEITNALDANRVLKQLGAGFYYRWKFPRGEPEELIKEWFDCRQAYNRELREKLKNREPHLDSPMLCGNAAARAWREIETGQKYDGDLPLWKSYYYRAWRDIKDRVYHETEAVWIDSFLVNDCAAWGLSNKGIIWYEHEAFGRKVADVSRLPLHGGGPGAEARISREKGDRSIVASIDSHGTGRDGLQLKFSTQLVPNPPAAGNGWEQLLGRLHRIGQEADAVHAQVYRHTEEMRQAIDRAVAQARYVQGLMGSSQKLLLATCDFDLDET